VVFGDGQLVVLRADRLHDPVQVLGIIAADAGCCVARGGGHEVVAGGRRQLHHMVAGAVEQTLQGFGLACRIARAGTGNDEHEWRGAALPSEPITQLFDRPEVVRQGELAFGTQAQVVVGLVDIVIGRHFGA